MNLRKLTKLRRTLEGLRRRVGSIRRSELETIATAVGRRRANRGKEPTYTRDGWFPLSIPDHPGTLAPGTARNIIACLESDLVRLEDELADDGELKPEAEEDHNDNED